MFKILKLFQLAVNLLFLIYFFLIISYFEFRSKVTINYSFPSTTTPPSNRMFCVTINERSGFIRIYHSYPNFGCLYCNICLISYTGQTQTFDGCKYSLAGAAKTNLNNINKQSIHKENVNIHMLSVNIPRYAYIYSRHGMNLTSCELSIFHEIP